MRISCVWCLFIGVAMCALAGCEGPEDRPEEPAPVEAERDIQRVVVIHLDTTRADALSCYGGLGRTPNIDTVAARGMRYANSVVPIAYTSPSVASFMTGRLANRNGVYFIGQGLDEKYTTLAEVLKAEGFATAGFTSNMVVANRADNMPSGYGQGFDRYEAIMDPIEVEADEDKRAVPRQNGRYLTDAALGYIDEHANDPFFLWMLYVDPHAPYAPMPPYDTLFADEESLTSQDRPLPLDGEWVHKQAVVEGQPNSAYYLQRYFGEVAMVDAWIGEILQRLDALEGKTLLVITSDHGESMGDYGIWFQHGNTIRYSCANVPLIIACDGSVPAGVSKSLVANIDVAPTILSLLDIDPRVLEPDGRSLVPTFGTIAPWPERMLPFQTDHGDPWRGIRTRNYSLQTLVDTEAESQQSLLFRLDKDLFESLDVSDRYPNMLRRLLQAQREWFADQSDWEPVVNLEWEMEMNERLEALGYL